MFSRKIALVAATILIAFTTLCFTAAGSNAAAFSAFDATLPTDHFRTQFGGGTWGDPSIWQSSHTGDFTDAITATLSPTSAANTITVRMFEAVQISADVTIDQTTVQTGAFMIVDPGVTLTVSDGTGTDLTISSGVQFQVYGPIINNGQIQIDGTLSLRGGSLSAAPSYGSASTLQYSFTDPTNRGAEWTPGATSQPGYPANVSMFSAATFNLANGVTDQPFQMSGNLTIFGPTQFDMTGMTKPLTVLGNVSNSDTITLSDVAGGDLRVAGNFANTGTFVPRQRAVILMGATGQTISGNTSFYDLFKSISGGSQTLKFAAGSTTTVTDWLLLTGTSGNILSLRSTSSGSQWNLVAGATQTASFVNVQDSNNTGTTITPFNSVDGGNNIGWAFPHTLTVTVSGGGTVTSSPPGISCPGSCSASFASPPDVMLTAAPTAGSHFVNWTGSVTSSSNPVNVTMDAAKSVTANFAVNNYTLSYNANGGSGTDPASSSVAFNSSVTTASNPYTRTGFAFSGWNTAADGSGTQVAAGASFTMPASNTTLYAQWRGSVTYIANNATGGAAPVDGSSPYLAGATVTVLTNSGGLVRTGYTLAGWNTQAGGTGADLAPAATFTMMGNFTLYAKWTNVSAPAITYTPIPNTLSTANPTVVVTASDPDGISAMKIFSGVNGGSFNAGDACTLATGTVTSGTWNCTISGSLNPNSAISYYVTATDNTGATAINPAGGALEPNLYTIGAATVPAGTFNYLSLSDLASLGGDVMVTGTLNLGGTVSTGSNTLELACSGSVTGAGGYNYVVGNFKKDFCGTGSFTFPSGTTPNGSRPVVEVASTFERAASLFEEPEGNVNAPEYTPMSMTVNSGTFPAAITVSVADELLTGLKDTNSVSRSWNVSQTLGSVNADMTFNYLDQDAAGTEANYKVYKNANNATTEVTPNSVNPAANTASVTGVTAFSNWGVGVLIPTAADVSISGRVMTADGRGIQNAMVTVTGNNLSQPVVVITGPFGYYSVGSLEAGQTYVVTVNSKRFHFLSPSRVVNLVDNLAGFDFVASP